MTAFPIGTVVKDLATKQQLVVIDYRAADDTVLVTDAQAEHMMRLDASHAGLVCTHAWDSDAAQQWHTTVRTSLLRHVDTDSWRVACWVSGRLDLAGQASPL